MFAQKTTHAVGVAVVLGLLLLSSTALGQEPSNQRARNSGVEQTIRQLENQRVQALLRNDSTFIERNYADDYLTTSAAGLVRNRTQVAADLKSGTIKYESMTHDDVRLRVYGNSVIVTGLDSVKGVDKGQDITGQRRFTRVWVKQGGRWRLAANQTTRIP